VTKDFVWWKKGQTHNRREFSPAQNVFFSRRAAHLTTITPGIYVARPRRRNSTLHNAHSLTARTFHVTQRANSQPITQPEAKITPNWSDPLKKGGVKILFDLVIVGWVEKQRITLYVCFLRFLYFFILSLHLGVENSFDTFFLLLYVSGGTALYLLL
jgi:hypothetical protein